MKKDPTLEVTAAAICAFGVARMWIVGADFYGKVDRIPGVCHVRTRFLHVMFIPFVPTGSFLIVEPQSAQERAHPPGPELQKAGDYLIAEADFPSQCASLQRIRLSWKSLLFGWLRALLVILIVGCWSTALEIHFGKVSRSGPGTGPGSSFALGAAVLGAIFCGLYLLTLPLGRPGRSRREQLLVMTAKSKDKSSQHEEAYRDNQQEKAPHFPTPLDPHVT